MKSVEILYTDHSQHDALATSFRHKQAHHKKYLLHKMKTDSLILKEKTLRQMENPAYFEEMYKQQKKKLHVNTFIKKLKNSISLRRPSEENVEFLEKCEIQKFDFRFLQVPKIIYFAILFIIALQNIFLLVLNSISIIFQGRQEGYFKWLLIFSTMMHAGEMIKKSLLNLDLQQNKKQSTLQVMEKYFYSFGFFVDVIMLFCLFIQVVNINQTLQYIGKFIICLKAKNLMQIQSYLEITFIQNQYRQQIWSLIKVFIFNFIFAHILVIFLVLMAQLDQTQNWILKKQLDPECISQIYIWAYYWATTIMLTVGFGDLTPTNTSQALCMIFIQTLSCVVLAYNINRLGVIIQKIRSYDLQQINNMKAFNQMNQKSEFSKQSKQKISNYIRESTIIKRNFNLEEQKNFLSRLPPTFKNQLCKEMYRPIWNGMTFFQNLSEKVLLNLSISIQKKLTHPEEIVYSKGSQIDIMIFSKGKFGFTYQNGKSKRNGEIIHSFQVGKKQFKLSTLEFLFQNQLPYNIKCQDYSLFYSINLQNLLKILKQTQYDYEYYFMVKDKDKYLMNEFQLIKCQFCPNQRHSLFKCPKCHYIPLKRHIIDKHRLKNKMGTYFTLQKEQRKVKILNKSLINLKRISNQGHKKQVQISNQKRQIEGTYVSTPISKQSCSFSEKIIKFKQINAFNNSVSKQVQNSHMLQNALSKVQKNLKNQLIESKPFWQIQTDRVYNFKYYFKKYNAGQFLIKKTKSNNNLKALFKAQQKL